MGLELAFLGISSSFATCQLWPWGIYCTALCLSFPVCQIVPTSLGCSEEVYMLVHRNCLFSTVPGPWS